MKIELDTISQITLIWIFGALYGFALATSIMFLIQLIK